MNHEAKKYIEEGVGKYGLFEPEKAVACFYKALELGVPGILVYRLMASAYINGYQNMTKEQSDKAKCWLLKSYEECTTEGKINEKFITFCKENAYQCNLSGICFDLATLYYKECDSIMALKYYVEALRYLTECPHLYQNHDEWLTNKCVSNISNIIKKNPRSFVEMIAPTSVKI